MGTSLYCMNEVGKGKDLFMIAVVVLDTDIKCNAFLLTSDKNRFGKEGAVFLVDVIDKGFYSAFISVFNYLFGSHVLQDYLESWI